MNTKTLNIILISLLAILHQSCEKVKEEGNLIPTSGLKGIFCINEGAFMSGNGSVSFYPENGDPAISDVFGSANGFPIGDLPQSMCIYDERAYICVNNSQKVEVVSMSDFKRSAVLYGINSPRYFVPLGDGTGVVSDWYTNQVYRIQLSGMQIIDSVLCGNGPEQMLVSNGKLFVCNSGGFGNDSSISIINIAGFQPGGTIATGVNPSFIKEDNQGNLIVLCRGSLGDDYAPSPDDPGGMLMLIQPSNNTVLNSLSFAYDEHPLQLQLDASKSNIYYLMGNYFYTGKIYKRSSSDFTGQGTILTGREFYSLGVSPADGSIYAGNYAFSANTYVVRFSNDGTLLDSLECGIGPGNFVFN